MYRKPEKEKTYKAHFANTGDQGCPFCNLDDPKFTPVDRKTIEESKHAVIIENIFAFDIWEGFKATDHLMLIPRRHVANLGELNQAERREIMDLYCKYETLGYNIYSRAPGSDARTFAHVHTHFIKIEGERAQRIEYTRKPYNLTIEW